MSLAGIFTAIIIAMSVVPFLGYIPLGFMNATIIHVPVIIGAIILGPKYGAYLGLVFGVTSLVKASDLLRIQPVRYDRRIQRKHVERRDRHRAACMHRHRCLFCL